MASMLEKIQEGNAKYENLPLESPAKRFIDTNKVVQSTYSSAKDLGRKLLKKGSDLLTGEDVKKGLK